MTSCLQFSRTAAAQFSSLTDWSVFRTFPKSSDTGISLKRFLQIALRPVLENVLHDCAALKFLRCAALYDMQTALRVCRCALVHVADSSCCACAQSNACAGRAHAVPDAVQLQDHSRAHFCHESPGSRWCVFHATSMIIHVNVIESVGATSQAGPFSHPFAIMIFSNYSSKEGSAQIPFKRKLKFLNFLPRFWLLASREPKSKYLDELTWTFQLFRIVLHFDFGVS